VRSWVQGLLPLVVAAEYAADAPRLPEGVQLVDEDDARGLLLGLSEEIAHPRRPDADEHLDEVGPAQAEEGDPRLPRHRLRQQGLAGPRGPNDQDALGDLSAQPTVPLGGLQELDDLHQLGLRLVDPCHVGKGHPGLLLHVDLGLALADRQHAAGPAHPLHEDTPEAEEDQGREDPRQQRREPGVLELAAEAHLRRLQLLNERRIVHTDGDEAVLPLAEPLELMELLLGQQPVQALRLQRAGDGALFEREVPTLPAFKSVLKSLYERLATCGANRKF
jgi:hypothetical protein